MSRNSLSEILAVSRERDDVRDRAKRLLKVDVGVDEPALCFHCAVVVRTAQAMRDMMLMCSKTRS
jgi:hypothetical protein